MPKPQPSTRSVPIPFSDALGTSAWLFGGPYFTIPQSPRTSLAILTQFLTSLISTSDLHQTSPTPATDLPCMGPKWSLWIPYPLCPRSHSISLLEIHSGRCTSFGSERPKWAPRVEEKLQLDAPRDLPVCSKVRMDADRPGLRAAVHSSRLAVDYLCWCEESSIVQGGLSRSVR